MPIAILAGWQAVGGDRRTASTSRRRSTILAEFQRPLALRAVRRRTSSRASSGSCSASGSAPPSGSCSASRSASRSGRAGSRCRTSSTGARCRRRPCCRSRHPPALDREHSRRCRFIAFFCIFPVLLNTIDGVRGIDPTLMETARSYGIPRREQIRQDRVPGGAATDLGRDAAEPLAGGDHHGRQRVLLEHERRRLRAADLEEHVPARADVGGDPADRHASATSSTSRYLLAERRFLAWHRGWRAATPQ